MKIRYITVALLMIAGLALGQKVKSKGEQEAVLAMLQAQTPDAKIAAVENLITKFKDTEFKAIALESAGEAYQQKGDSINAILYGDRALEADPKSYQAMLLVSGQLAQNTQEFALDKDERLNRATKLANNAITTIASAPKPNPQLSDDRWEAIKKDFTAQAHDTLGIVAMNKKQYDVAEKEFQTSISTAATPDPATSVRLASVYDSDGKPDQGIDLLNKLLATPGINDAVKRVATNEKARAEKLKAAK